MKYIKTIIYIFSNYSTVIDEVSSILTFITPTKSKWFGLGKPSETCHIYAYRKRSGGGYNQVPIDDLTEMNQLEISEKLTDEFGDVE